MKRKWIIGSTIAVSLVGLFAIHFAKSRQQNPSKTEIDPVSDSNKNPESTDVEAQVTEMLDRAWAAANTHDYEQAYRICEEAINRFGAVAIEDGDTYSSYRELIGATREHIACVQRRSPEKAFSKAEDLKNALVLALKNIEPKAIAELLRCGMGVGVPASEYGFDYHPEKLATELASLRKAEQKPLDFKAEGETSILTSGYSDGEIRRFDLNQDEKTHSWFIASLLYGKESDIRDTP